MGEMDDMAMRSRDAYAVGADEEPNCGLCNEPIQPFSPTVDVCEGTLSSKGYVAFPNTVTSYHRLCYQNRLGGNDTNDGLECSSWRLPDRQNTKLRR